jgi:diaminohydroxyphosphoribosylaminopyrimidine deaminase/5-amino-6-(5-phosphoribosylamino)uracil reductase
MARALDLARAQLGKTAPNPAVGCVIVRAGVVVGEGATGDGGRPHAEEIALDAAGDAAAGATAYVTLEPCSARSSGSPACARRLADAGVVRVVVACEDPNPDAAHGLSRLGAAGVEAVIGVRRAEAEALNCGFFKLVRTGRPWLAVDADLARYDAAYAAHPDEAPEAALARLGAAGLTRIVLPPGAPDIPRLRALGLIDADHT